MEPSKLLIATSDCSVMVTCIVAMAGAMALDTSSLDRNSVTEEQERAGKNYKSSTTIFFWHIQDKIELFDKVN